MAKMRKTCNRCHLPYSETVLQERHKTEPWRMTTTRTRHLCLDCRMAYACGKDERLCCRCKERNQ